MVSKIYALVGGWDFKPRDLGLSVYRYNSEDAALDYMDTYFPEVCVGQQFLDNERRMVYITNECDSLPGKIGGGGSVLAIEIDGESGKLSLLNRKASLAVKPSYVWVDKTKRYALVPHHGGRGHVTKILRKAGGGLTSETLFDDAALVLFRLEADGSLGEPCDALITPGKFPNPVHALSHQHSVVGDPSGSIFIVCDKGTDEIYSLRIDYKTEKLVLLDTAASETGNAPRYSVFHPVLPVFYSNNETNPVLSAYHYDKDSGVLTPSGELPLTAGKRKTEDGKTIMPSDIVIEHGGRFLFVSLRDTETIAVVALDGAGNMELRQTVNCEGKNPRGLTLSPDEQYLFSLNVGSDNISAFVVAEDGTLSFTGKMTKALCPGTMKFVTV
ncbi:MAG: lactonase family protein [Treponema sp.]|jgi:6-phosphogluconolactonase (cycloisomerase 2 family)|nr:lactonase family protein [Treponema sp.]